MNSGMPIKAKSMNVCGSEIRRIRKAKGLTLDDLAARMEFEAGAAGIEISPGQLAKIERGEKRLTDRGLIAAARALRVRVDELIPEDLRYVEE